MKENIFRLTLLLLLAFFSSAAFAQLMVGSRIWAEDNLGATTYSNGEKILEARSKEEFFDMTLAGKPCFIRSPKAIVTKFNERYMKGEYIILENFFSDFSKYDCKQVDCGLVYNWYAVNDPRGLAPKGWHVATRDDWNYLAKYYESRVGTKYFGHHLIKDGFLGQHWWTADRVLGATSNMAYCIYLYNITRSASLALDETHNDRSFGKFVRCVKD